MKAKNILQEGNIALLNKKQVTRWLEMCIKLPAKADK